MVINIVFFKKKMTKAVYFYLHLFSLPLFGQQASLLVFLRQSWCANIAGKEIRMFYFLPTKPVNNIVVLGENSQ